MSALNAMHSDEAADSVVQIAGGAIQVTSWNILAPVWADPSYYAKRSVPHLDPATRRATIARRLQEIDSDVVMMQEVEGTELQKMRDECAALDSTWEIHFFAFPKKLWSNWLKTDPVDNGLCVMLRKGAFSNVATEFHCIDPQDGRPTPEFSMGNAVVIVRCTANKFGATPLAIVCNHLDADSGLLAERQVKYLHAHLAAMDPRPATIWGGDFNLERRCRALRTVHKAGVFKCVFDGLVNEATASVYGMAGSARIDHIWVNGQLELDRSPELAPTVPECTLPYILGTRPVHTTSLWLKETVLGSWWRLIILIILLLAFLPFTLIVLVLALRQNRQAGARSEWALVEQGSDHLPVTCSLRLAEAGAQF